MDINDHILDKLLGNAFRRGGHSTNKPIKPCRATALSLPDVCPEMSGAKRRAQPTKLQRTLKILLSPPFLKGDAIKVPVAFEYA